MTNDNIEINPKGPETFIAPTNNENLTQPNKAELFWNENEAVISEETIKLIKTCTRPDYFEEELEDLEKYIETEKKFATAVVEKVENVLANSTKETFLLFDIDETIAAVKLRENNQYQTFIRPAVIPLFNYLKMYIDAQKLKIGFLSSRGKEAMENQLQDENQLLPIANFIDKDLIFSSRGLEDEYYKPAAEILTEKYGNTEDNLVKDESLAYCSEDYYCLTTGDGTKIDRLTSIKKDHPDNKIIVVDDFIYPRTLNENKGVYGVSLRNSGLFSLPW